jgi:aryl-alcohol dehydrogenase-like predicted oxidoreductase
MVPRCTPKLLPKVVRRPRLRTAQQNPLSTVHAARSTATVVGEALQGRRDDIVLATKFFMPMDDRPNHSGGSRKWIIQEVENSLRRLETDYIDRYQVHRPSATTGVAEALGALTDLVHQGKIRYIGSSSYPASQWD